MSFGIDIDGLDDLKKELERLSQQPVVPVSILEVNNWCKKIVSQAKLNCPDEKKAEIRLECVEKADFEGVGFSYSESKELLPYLRDAILINLPNMSPITKMVFEVLLKDVQQTMDKDCSP
jgi:hypothetical protein